MTVSTGPAYRVPRRVAVISAGPAALRLIEEGQAGGAPLHGTVLAAFRRSAYLSFGADALVCIGRRLLGNGPLNVVCDAEAGFLTGLVQDEPVSADTDGLQLPGGRSLLFARARQWNPPALPPPTAWRPRADILSVLADRISRFPRQDGLGPLIAPLCTGPESLTAPTTGDRHLLAAAVPAIVRLLAWLDESARDETASPAPVSRLIGLGPGLTPSGDDFLIGLLVGLHGLGRKRLAGALAASVRIASVEGTGMISRAHLLAACDGLGAEALHRALAALVACDVPAFDRALVRLDDTGHSSGRDALAGLAACLATVGDG